MPESLRTRLRRHAFNLFPALRGTGARITYIDDEYREVRVRLPLNWRTRNYVGTIFGGSMYGAVDPIYMIMLIKRLGPEYVVWDRAATIRFEAPGRSTLYAVFTIPDDELDEIRALLEREHAINRDYRVELKDGAGKVHATVDKTIYIRKKKQPQPTS